MNRLHVTAAWLLALFSVGCPSEGPDTTPPPPPPPATDGAADSDADTPLDAEVQREVDAWRAIEAQGAWARLLPGKLKKGSTATRLEAAMSDANADAMRRLALLVRFSPIEDAGRVLKISVVLRRHAEKNPQLEGWLPDDPRTIALVLLPDANLMSTTRWLHYATGWTSVNEGVATKEFHLQTASDIRTALAHAQNGRWEQSIPLYREVFVRLAKLNTDRQGSKSKPAWDAAEKLLESGDLGALETALEAWWRTFVPPKPKAD